MELAYIYPSFVMNAGMTASLSILSKCKGQTNQAQSPKVPMSVSTSRMEITSHLKNCVVQSVTSQLLLLPFGMIHLTRTLMVGLVILGHIRQGAIGYNSSD